MLVQSRKRKRSTSSHSLSVAPDKKNPGLRIHPSLIWGNLKGKKTQFCQHSASHRTVWNLCTPNKHWKWTPKLKNASVRKETDDFGKSQKEWWNAISQDGQPKKFQSGESQFMSILQRNQISIFHNLPNFTFVFRHTKLLHTTHAWLPRLVGNRQNSWVCFVNS